MGTFQLGGSGMTRWLKELKPTDINDIMAMCDIKAKTSYTQLLPIMRQVRAKCESRYGHELPGCDYEVLVTFLPQ